MALRINTNPVSLRAQQNLAKAQGALTSNVERLSSGLRINRAGDDAAGSSISSKLSSDVRGLASSIGKCKGFIVTKPQRSCLRCKVASC